MPNNNEKQQEIMESFPTAGDKSQIIWGTSYTGSRYWKKQQLIVSKNKSF